MTPVYLEIGNVLTRASLVLEASTADGMETPPQVREEATPTTVYGPAGSAVSGYEAVLAAAGLAARPDEDGAGVALLHLNGAPRTAVMGLAGLPTTELTIQAALRHAGSSVVQIRSTDAANLEAQLVEVRSVPLDVLAFTAATALTAERLLAGGGIRPRVLPKLLAMYNGPAGEAGQIASILADAVELTILPPIRVESGRIDPAATERWMADATDRAMAEDPALAALRERGFVVEPYARAFTRAAEAVAARPQTVMEDRRNGRGRVQADSAVRSGVALIDLGGRFTEMAAAAGGGSRASRWVEDLDELRLTVPSAIATKGKTVEGDGTLDVETIGRWLPFEWATTGLADALSNYLRRPFTVPSNWRQVLTMMALGRVRLARARLGFRGSSGTGELTGDWRPAVGSFVVSGGYLRNLPGPGLALALILDGLEPVGVTELWCDRYGLLPFLALDGRDLRMTGTDPLVPRLATVVAPSLLHIDWRRPHDDDLLALVTVERENGASTTFRIVPGGLMRFPLRPGERATLTVHPMRENDFGAGPGKVWRGNVVGGLLGLVFDARGRPVALPADAKVRQAKLLEWLDTLEGGRSGWAGERV